MWIEVIPYALSLLFLLRSTAFNWVGIKVLARSLICMFLSLKQVKVPFNIHFRIGASNSYAIAIIVIDLHKIFTPYMSMKWMHISNQFLLDKYRFLSRYINPDMVLTYQIRILEYLITCFVEYTYLAVLNLTIMPDWLASNFRNQLS